MGDEQQGPVVPGTYLDKPSPARLWNYLQGGKDNVAADREVGDVMVENYPEMFYLARQSRQFLMRALRFVATEASVRQFLDIGCGLPTPPELPNVHELVQGIHPDARVVYVDNDKVVLSHAHALLTPASEGGVCAYLEADGRDTDYVLTEAGRTLDFTEPVAVIMLGLLGAVETAAARAVVSGVMGAVAAGSYLVVEDGADVSATSQARIAQRSETVGYYCLRTPEQMRQFFKGLDLVEPGLVPITLWRPEPAMVGVVRPVEAYGAVARKP